MNSPNVFSNLIVACCGGDPSARYITWSTVITNLSIAPVSVRMTRSMKPHTPMTLPGLGLGLVAAVHLGESCTSHESGKHGRVAPSLL